MYHQMMKVSVICLLLLWSLVYVHCQTAPYITFMGQTLADHSYVDISQLGRDVSGSDSVQCHTDLETCCRGAQGPHRGDWYFPDGTRLPFPDVNTLPPIFEARQLKRVDLRRNSGTEPTGIYHCDIETVAGVNGNGMRETVYVGLYTSDGGIYVQSNLCKMKRDIGMAEYYNKSSIPQPYIFSAFHLLLLKKKIWGWCIELLLHLFCHPYINLHL